MTLLQPYESSAMTMTERLRERDEIHVARILSAHEKDGEAMNVRAEEEPLAGRLPADHLKLTFLERVRTALAGIRTRAGLSRQQLADRAGVPANLVEELELVAPHSLTLEQFVDLALACGYMPLEPTLAPADDVHQFAEEVAGGPGTDTAFHTWLARRGVRRALAAANATSRR
ncbi:MAG TPA: hypothetical protein VF221_20480 [Chloroflexota bacterium]